MNLLYCFRYDIIIPSSLYMPENWTQTERKTVYTLNPDLVNYLMFKPWNLIGPCVSCYNFNANIQKTKAVTRNVWATLKTYLFTLQLHILDHAAKFEITVFGLFNYFVARSYKYITSFGTFIGIT